MQAEDVLPRLIARRATGERADSPFIEEVGGRTLTYRQTHQAALAAAGFYQRQLGVVADEPIAVMLPTVAETVTTWLALGWLRAIELQVNTQLRGKLLTYVLRNSDASVLITAERYLPVLAEVLPAVENIEQVVVIDAAPAGDRDLGFAITAGPDLEGQPAEIIQDPAPDDVASVLFTSGTTGPSKGVILPWAHIHATATAGFRPAGHDTRGRLLRALRDVPHHREVGDLYDRPRGRTTGAAGELQNRRVLGGRRAPSVHDDRPDGRDGAVPERPAGARAGGDATSQRDDGAADPRGRGVQGALRRARPVVLQHDRDLGADRQSGLELPNPESCGRLRPGCHLRIVDEHDRDSPTVRWASCSCATTIPGP